MCQAGNYKHTAALKESGVQVRPPSSFLIFLKHPLLAWRGSLSLSPCIHLTRFVSASRSPPSSTEVPSALARCEASALRSKRPRRDARRRRRCSALHWGPIWGRSSWHGGRRRRCLVLHVRPATGAAPGRCEGPMKPRRQCPNAGAGDETASSLRRFRLSFKPVRVSERAGVWGGATATAACVAIVGRDSAPWSWKGGGTCAPRNTAIHCAVTRRAWAGAACRSGVGVVGCGRLARRARVGGRRVRGR
jgi:hypothetical protein